MLQYPKILFVFFFTCISSTFYLIHVYKTYDMENFNEYERLKKNNMEKINYSVLTLKNNLGRDIILNGDRENTFIKKSMKIIEKQNDIKIGLYFELFLILLKALILCSVAYFLLKIFNFIRIIYFEDDGLSKWCIKQQSLDGERKQLCQKILKESI